MHAGLGQATCQGPFAGSSKFTVRYLGRRLTWNMSFAKETETRIAPALECVANVGRFLVCASQRQLKKCNVFKAIVQGAILSGLCAFAGQNGSFTKNGLFPLKVCHNRLAHRLFAMTRRTWDSEPKQVTNHEQKKCTERLELCQLQRSSEFVEWAGQRAGKKFANTSTQQWYKVATSCTGDHQFKEEEIGSVGEFSKVCAQIVRKCLYLARIGRRDILWSVNKLARAITKWTRACDKRLARVISYIHHTSEFKQHCHVGNTAQQCRLGLSQDSDFTGYWKFRIQHRAESYAFLEVTRSCQ